MTTPAKILCIDDEPGMIELVSLILRPQQYDILGANSGAEGLDLMRTADPDLVLLDIMMPDMDGWEVYKQMRAEPGLRSIPVIIVTARDSSFEEVIARTRVGVDDYITKPFLPDELRGSVAKILERNQ